MPRRVAVVMASSRGLGFACASALADQGLDLVVCGRDKEVLQEAVEQLQRSNVQVHGVVADVQTTEGIAHLFTTATSEFGRLDVVVTNAGGPSVGTFRDISEEAWVDGFDLTLMSAVRAIQQALPSLSSAPHGRVVVIGSSSVIRPIANLHLSNVFRPALAGLVRSLGVELADVGITVNLVAPGRFDTDRVHSLDVQKADTLGVKVEAIREASSSKIPFGRYGDPRELAGVVAFLASEQASYVTGQTILVDGGMTLNS